MSNELTHPLIQNGWFMEISDTMWPGQANSFKVEKILHHEKSKYQDVLVFKSTNHGNVLVLDNAVQCTEFDEFVYHEMITHLPMYLHPNPKKVLVIGGGDGGVLREVLKHKSVEEAWLCDIDEAVVRVSKQYLSDISVAYNDPKVKVHICDGFEFLKQYKNTFDVIITDSSDPEGPAEGLFKRPYYELLHEALTENGVIASQSECVWLSMNVVKDLKDLCSDLFASVGYAYSVVPTYPSGNIGYMVATKNKDVDVRKPVREVTEAEERKLRYYNKSVHEASFVLPSFAKEALMKE